MVTAFGKVINTDSDEQNAMAGSLAFTSTTFTIATGIATPTRTNVILAAESGTTDTLDSMATTSVSDGCICILSVDSGDTITINDAGGAAGQIHLVDSQDLIMTGNDRLAVIRDGTDWYELWRSVDNQQVVQVVNTQTGAVATGTTVMVVDDTIPQNTEGNEWITQAITPKDATNILIIDVVLVMASSNAGQLVAALFQDSTANALAAAAHDISTSNKAYTVSFRHKMAAGTTSSTTFKVRGGDTAAATVTLNGESGARVLGGVLASSITITEMRT